MKKIAITEKIQWQRICNVFFTYLCLSLLISVSKQYLGIVRLVWSHDLMLLLVLFLSVVLDMLFIFFMVHLLDKKLEIPTIMCPVLVVTVIPVFVGLIDQNVGRSFFTDIISYQSYALKTIIFFTLFRYEEFVEVFYRFIKIFVSVIIISSAIALTIMLTLFLTYKKFYPSLYVDLTLPLAYLIVNGHYWGSLVAFFLAFLSGKRMLMIGAVIIFILAARKYIPKYVLFCLFLLPVILYILGSINHTIPGTARLTHTVNDISKKISERFTSVPVYSSNGEQSGKVTQLLQSMDKIRYEEVKVTFASLTGLRFIFGTGYGFRYQLDIHPTQILLGITHANAHFTPAGIFLKFGMIGFVVWYSLFLYALFCSIKMRNNSPLDYIAFLYLCSMLIQSFFAYQLFLDRLLPIILGYVLARQANAQKYSYFNGKYRNSLIPAKS